MNIVNHYIKNNIKLLRIFFKLTLVGCIVQFTREAVRSLRKNEKGEIKRFYHYGQTIEHL